MNFKLKLHGFIEGQEDFTNSLGCFYKHDRHWGGHCGMNKIELVLVIMNLWLSI
jgi:hypothetical protein